MKIRLRYLLAAAFIIIATVPVVFLGLWVQRTALEKEIGAVQEKHLLLARNITAALERYVNDTRAVFQHFRGMAMTRQPVDGAESLAAELGFRHFCVIADDGTVSFLVRAEGGADVKVPDELLQRIQSYIAEDSVGYSDVMANAAGDPAIFITQRLPDGRIALAELATDYIVRLQKAIAFGRKGHAAIVDRRGNLIAHPNPEWQRTMKNIAKVRPVSLMIAGDTGVTTFYSPAVKKDMITGYTTVPGVGWGVMVPQPFEELEEKAEHVRLAALLLILAGLAVAGALSWVISGVLIRPIEAVVRAAREIAGGALDARVPAQAGPVPLELKELAHDFNAMAGQIQDDQEALAEAVSTAQLANRAKSEFLANMSHELRTPLNAIIGFAEVIKSQLFGPLGDQQYRSYADHIHQSGEHLLAIIDDILDLSKIETGRLEIDDQVVDCNEVIDTALTLIRERAKEGRVTLEIQVPGHLPAVRGSEGRLKQVLTNLLSNAVKFTPEQGQVTVRAGLDPDGRLLMSVIDTGIGMSDDDISRALEPFGQVDSKFSRRYEGTGLGLPLAKRLIELHDGGLEIASARGAGTTVTVWLPATRVIPRAAE